MIKDTNIRNSGFTLLELSILIICMGLLMVGAMSVYDSYAKRQNMDRTIASLEIINAAIMEYRDTHGFYPRPAQMNLAYGHPEYGEDFMLVNPSINPAIGECVSGICKVTGRDADNDGNDDTILIGEIPYETLNRVNNFTTIPFENAYDAWGQKIKYVVTESLVDNTPPTFSAFNGAIYVEDENGLNVLNEPGIAHFILISHGMNGKGAYSKLGGTPQACTTGLTTDESGNPLPANPPASMLEADLRNCDDTPPNSGDGVFVSGLYSTADNRRYFDDYVFFQAWSSRDIWERVPDVNDQRSIYNTNLGDVGVGIPDPSQKLDIAGGLRAETIYSDPIGGTGNEFDTVEHPCLDGSGNVIYNCGICNGTQTDCMPAVVLGGELEDMDCDTGEVVTSIENNSVKGGCTTVPAVNVDTTVCIYGIQRIFMNGTVECAPP